MVDGSDEERENCLCISTVRKEMVLSADSKEELHLWLRNLRSAKERAIKENLGHAIVKEDHKYSNSAGNLLFQRRIKREREDVINSTSEVELTMMVGSNKI